MVMQKPSKIPHPLQCSLNLGQIFLEPTFNDRESLLECDDVIFYV